MYTNKDFGSQHDVSNMLNVPKGQKGVQFQPDADDEPTDEGRLEHDLPADVIERRTQPEQRSERKQPTSDAVGRPPEPETAVLHQPGDRR